MDSHICLHSLTPRQKRRCKTGRFRSGLRAKDSARVYKRPARSGPACRAALAPSAPPSADLHSFLLWGFVLSSGAVGLRVSQVAGPSLFHTGQCFEPAGVWQPSLRCSPLRLPFPLGSPKRWEMAKAHPPHRRLCREFNMGVRFFLPELWRRTGGKPVSYMMTTLMRLFTWRQARIRSLLPLDFPSQKTIARSA